MGYISSGSRLSAMTILGKVKECYIFIAIMENAIPNIIGICNLRRRIYEKGYELLF